MYDRVTIHPHESYEDGLYITTVFKVGYQHRKIGGIKYKLALFVPLIEICLN